MALAIWSSTARLSVFHPTSEGQQPRSSAVGLWVARSPQEPVPKLGARDAPVRGKGLTNARQDTGVHPHSRDQGGKAAGGAPESQAFADGHHRGVTLVQFYFRSELTDVK